MKKDAKSVLASLDDNIDAINDINQEIKEQNEKLLEMEDIIKESQTILKRAKELVSFFDKAFAKDLTLKIILFSICFMILGVIVFLVVYKTGNNQANVVTNTNALIDGDGHINCFTAMDSYSKAAVTIRDRLDCLEFNESLDNKLEHSDMEYPVGSTAGGNHRVRILRSNKTSRGRRLKKVISKYEPISDETRKLLDSDKYYKNYQRNLNMIVNKNNAARQ